MRHHIGVAAALALLLTACTDTEEAEEDPLARDDTAAEPAWTLDVDAVGQPEVRDGVAVVLTRARENELDVVAIDVATGEQLWDRPWSPGGVPPGFVVSPTVATDADGSAVVVHSEPPEDLGTEEAQTFRERIAGVELRTGDVRFRTDPVVLSTPVVECDGEQDACLGVRGEEGSEGQRIDLRSGEVSTDPDGAPSGARTLGEGVFATNDRPGEEIGLRQGGEVQWQHPIESVTAPGISSDNGWAFHSGDGLVLGSMRATSAEEEEREEAGEIAIDYSQMHMFALEADTGERRWLAEGRSDTCGVLDIVDVEDDELPRVRCALSGVASWESRESGPTSVADPSGAVEGFDPANGSATWSVELSDDAAEAIMTNDYELPVSDGTSALLPTPDGPQLVDLETGETTAPESTATFACRTEFDDIRYATPWVTGDDSNNRRNPGTARVPCDAAGEPTDAFTVSAVRDGGVEAEDGHYVLAVDGQLQGYEVGGG